MTRMLLAGNWKMNGVRAALAEIRAVDRALSDEPSGCDILICPPATLARRLRITSGCSALRWR